MTDSQKNMMIEEIDRLFVKFYWDNMFSFDMIFPSIMVDGEMKTYSSCVPDHICNRILEKPPYKI